MINDNSNPFDILLVEDEPADANLVKAALRENKVFCNLHHVLDGVEALAFLRRDEGFRDAPQPDMILLDLNMPRMNGREFLSAIKADAALQAIPVVVLTTSDVERDVAASYKLGAAGYITKPVDMEQFIDAIRQLGNYWFTLTRLPRKD
ncbi:two-component system response regulator [Sulfurimicrobium lacus]|uniref:Two-component system response regulator n=1 Tax=Sulfurimicrobium lacus TaxID=2715678 RepID=A0A6F8VCT5_9PROT|nr:response regulator [Sulfurimicrobium lacus]BCB26826.1 two-component system response regulator [Sulfurimicrobium lacus]